MKFPRSRTTLFFIIAAVGIAFWLIWETISQPGMEQWQGRVVEVAFYRNENNTGPIHRIYAVHAVNVNLDEMQLYGERMPHTKYGSTKVYFFSDRLFTPSELHGQVPHFDPEFNSHCTAVYEKNSMGLVTFKHNPFD